MLSQSLDSRTDGCPSVVQSCFILGQTLGFECFKQKDITTGKQLSDLVKHTAAFATSKLVSLRGSLPQDSGPDFAQETW